jgi:peptidase E
VWKDAPVPGHVVAMGGFDEALVRFALALAGTERPRTLYVPTAVGDDAEWIAEFRGRAPDRGVDPDELGLFGIPDEPLRRVAEADVILVNGGNTANMLAVWRVHGVADAIRDAWLRGAVLAGWSAGGNCWFESSVTDSFRADLDPLRDGLGLLPGSFCPHYDSEERRRPVYERLVADGSLPPGLACDDDVALHFAGTELVEAVTARDDARAWRVTAAGSAPLDARLLS